MTGLHLLNEKILLWKTIGECRHSYSIKKKFPIHSVEKCLH
nr:MAG TPA: hypothetical protein [Caudoviricetes sp.]